VLPVLAVAAAHVAFLQFLCDDAFIAFRYARNLAAGHGAVFNPGERVEGYTSFLWVAVNAAVIRLGGLPEIWAPRLSAAAALSALAVLLWREARRRAGAWIFGVLTAASAGWAAWATGGLETGLFTALVSLAFVATAEWLEAEAAGRPAGRPLAASGGLLALAVLTRPDGAGVAACAAAFGVWRVARGSLRPARLAAWAAIWAAPLAAHVLARRAYYGHFVPNTYHVKAAPGSSLVPVGAGYLLYAVRRLHLYLLALPFLALAAGAPRHRSPDRERAALAAVVVLPYLTYVVLVGGDFMDLFRFVVPVLPVVFLVAGDVLGALATGPRTRLAVAALLVVYAGANLRTSRDALGVHYRLRLDSIGTLKQYVADWTAIGSFVATLAEPSDSLAVTAAGCIPYASGLYTIDQLGLVAPDLEDYFARDVDRPGHGLQIRGAALLAMRPQFLLGAAVPTPPDQASLGFYVEPGFDQAFDREYRTASVLLPQLGGRRLTFGVRRDVAARVAARLERSAATGSAPGS